MSDYEKKLIKSEKISKNSDASGFGYSCDLCLYEMEQIYKIEIHSLITKVDVKIYDEKRNARKISNNLQEKNRIKKLEERVKNLKLRLSEDKEELRILESMNSLILYKNQKANKIRTEEELNRASRELAEANKDSMRVVSACYKSNNVSISYYIMNNEGKWTKIQSFNRPVDFCFNIEYKNEKEYRDNEKECGELLKKCNELAQEKRTEASTFLFENILRKKQRYNF